MYRRQLFIDHDCELRGKEKEEIWIFVGQEPMVEGTDIPGYQGGSYDFQTWLDLAPISPR